MAVFTLEEGRLVPAGHVDVLGSGLASRSLDAIRARVIELLERPLFPVSWQGERDADTLVALDATGRVVSIEVLAHLDSHELMAALARAGRYANLSRSQLAQIYSQGSEDFAREWQEFLDTCEPHPAPGPRLFLVVLSVDHTVRPAVQALAGAGLQVNLVQVHEAGDRVLVSIDEVRPLAPGISGMLASSWHPALADAQADVPVAVRADSAPSPEEAEVPDVEFGAGAGSSAGADAVAGGDVAGVAMAGGADVAGGAAGDSVEYVGVFSPHSAHVGSAAEDATESAVQGAAAHEASAPVVEGADEPVQVEPVVAEPASVSEGPAPEVPARGGHHKRREGEGARRRLGPRMARRHGAHRHLAEPAAAVVEGAQATATATAHGAEQGAAAGAAVTPGAFTLPPRPSVDTSAASAQKTSTPPAPTQVTSTSSAATQAGGQVRAQETPGGAAPIRLSPRIAQRPSARRAERVGESPKPVQPAPPEVPASPVAPEPAAAERAVAPEPKSAASEPVAPLVQPLVQREERHARPAAFGGVEGYVGPTAFAESVARQERARRRLEQRLWEEAAPSAGDHPSRGEANASYASSEAVAQAADRDYRSPAARLLGIARRNRAPFTVIWECEQRNVTYYGEVTAWGTLVISGFGTYTDPSSAARAVSALPGIDGWEVWKVQDGRSLGEL